MVKKEDLTGKELEYFKYIENHIALVKRVWDAFQKHPKTEVFVADDFNWGSLQWLIDSHDASKFSNDEFHGYRRYFYPKEGERTIRGDFENAWNRHQKANPHHWEHWVVIQGQNKVPLSMPQFHMLEMLMDWTAMSVDQGNGPSEWFHANQQRMLFDPDTKKIIERWLPIFDDIYRQLKK